MPDNRRGFIRKSAAVAALVSAGKLGAGMPAPNPAKPRAYARDAGMQLSEAYFWGPDPQRMAYCRQLGVTGAVAGVMKSGDLSPWHPKAIAATRRLWEKEGFSWNVIEGPPALGEKTKLGLDGRDEEISNFITFMKNIRQHAGIEVICYNWMPVIGWYRTDNSKPGRGGALVTAFDAEKIKNAPLTGYGEVSKERLWQNLEYFLKAVIPEAEKVGMKLAMHPDDPQVDSIKGIGRIMNTVDNFKRMLALVPSPSNGITLCQGNFALMDGVDIPKLVKDFGKDKIHFVHFRNVRGDKFRFEETFHDEGKIDMYAAMQACYDIGFRGPIRPDHTPTMAGDVNDHPGYSNVGILYALGYIRGLMESVAKQQSS